MKKLALALTLLFVVFMVAGSASSQDPVPPAESLIDAFPEQRHYSPYVGRNFPTEVFWGDTHLHTALSMDAGAFRIEAVTRGRLSVRAWRRGHLLDRAASEA